MDAQEFRKDFLEDVKADAAATGEGSCASFVASFARYLQGPNTYWILQPHILRELESVTESYVWMATLTMNSIKR